MASKALLHRLGVAQVQLHAADIGLVRDGFGVQLEHHGIADLVGGLHGRFGVGGDDGLRRRDAVGRQHLLGFELGQDGAPFAARPAE